MNMGRKGIRERMRENKRKKKIKMGGFRREDLICKQRIKMNDVQRKVKEDVEKE
jgi:hypothetical protein